LLFQTLLYPLAFSEGGTLILKGGTHVPFSPCYHYIKHVFLPVVKILDSRQKFLWKKPDFIQKEEEYKSRSFSMERLSFFSI